MHTKDENYGYTFLPAGGNSVVKFKVKAKSDAHIMLSETTDPYSPQSYYEVRTDKQTLGSDHKVCKE